MKTLLLVFLLMFLGCGEPPVDQRVKEYVRRFEAACNVESNASIVFGPMPAPNWVGFCRRGTREVFLDEPFWDWATDLSREQIIFHELGHCVLDQMEHREDSIMRFVMWSDREYAARRDYFINELCNWGK